MPRYIDADALIQLGLQEGAYEYVSVQEIADFPTADVVEVVRCEDCVYWEQATDNSGNCNRAFEITAYGSDYCSYGERRKDVYISENS